MFLKLRTVVYHVNDLAGARDWYKAVTGIAPYFDEPFYVGFDINGFELGLDPDMTGVTPGNQSAAYWLVDDIEASVKKIADAGATLLQDVTEVGGGIRVATLTDPWGNAIGLIQGA
jgi:predicted enzyme related to lactoylglutathione lyase